MAQTHSLDLESGSSQYASVADAAPLRLSGDFTVEAWIKLETLSTTLGYSQTIISKDDTSIGWTFRVESGANKLDFVRNDATQYTGATALITGVWYHVAVTMSAATIKVYLNGKEDFSGAYTDHTDATTSSLRVGNSTSNATRYLDGLIKDVRLFSDARTAAEVAADAHTETVSDANLIAEWNFNNAYTDSSGSGYTLTSSGSPTFSVNIPWYDPTSVSSTSPFTTGLIGYWKFDQGSGSVVDAYTGTYTLTLSGSPVYAQGKINNGLDLERGSSQYASVADAAGLEPGSAFSLAGWIKLESATTGVAYTIASKGTSTGNQRGFVFKISDAGTIALQCSSAGTSFNGDVSVSWTESTATWIHIAVTFSSGSVKFYINGSQQGATQTSAISSIFNNTGSFGFGAGNISGTPDDFFDGVIDEFGYWNTALTATDITNLYNSGNGRAFGDKLVDGLVSYWSLEETSGTRTDAHSTNDLTDNNTVLSGTGIQSNAADFEKDNSEYLSITDAAQTGLDITGNLSISFWWKPETHTVFTWLISKYLITGNQRSYGIYFDSNTLDFVISTDGTNISTSTKAFTPSDGTWYHIVGTYSTGGTMTLYVNGAQIGSATGYAGSIFNGTGAFIIGGREGENAVDGLIDEAAVYSRTLHYGDVLDLYNGGTGIAYAAAGPANVKTLNGITLANVKTINGIALSSVKTINGIA